MKLYVVACRDISFGEEFSVPYEWEYWADINLDTVVRASFRLTGLGSGTRIAYADAGGLLADIMASLEEDERRDTSLPASPIASELIHTTRVADCCLSLQHRHR